MNKAIELSNASFSYRKTQILSNVDLSISSGECIGIFGPNGGGKTTLLRLIMGFIPPQSGSVRLFNDSPAKNRHRIGYVPQVHRTDPDFPITVAELITMGRLSKRPFFRSASKQDREECERWMEKLSLLPHKDKSYGELSGGLAQRALLARALIADPDLLLLDEPTANIDAHSLEIFLQTLEELKDKKTILLVTHDLQSILKKAGRFICIQGKITIFKPNEICEHFALGLYHSPLMRTNPHVEAALR